MGRSVDQPLTVRREITAGRAAVARTHQLLVRAVGIHGEFLIAFVRLARGLKNDLFAVGPEIGFSILAGEGELTDVAQVNFLRMTRDGLLWRRIDRAKGER